MKDKLKIGGLWLALHFNRLVVAVLKGETISKRKERQQQYE